MGSITALPLYHFMSVLYWTDQEHFFFMFHFDMVSTAGYSFLTKTAVYCLLTAPALVSP